MLDSRRVAVPPVCDPCRIARRVTPGAASLEPSQTMPLSSVKTGRLEPLRIWRDPDADHNHVGAIRETVDKYDPGDARLADDVG